MASALPTDADLVAALLARDEQMFALVVRRWSPAMLRLARYHVDSVAVAEEVVQETWIAVLRQLAGFEGRAAFGTWALRICANLARRHGVREHRSEPIGLPGEETTVSPSRFRAAGEPWAGYWLPDGKPGEWAPEGRALAGETERVLAEALRTLPDRQGHVVALRDVHGLATDEVADLLGLSVGNVRVILHRGRAVLRERLADYFAEEVSSR